MPSVRNVLRRTSNQLLGRFGLTLERRESVASRIAFDRDRYERAIGEMEGCFRERIFPDLPPCQGRHALMAELLGTQISEAFYIVALLHRSLALDGDVCELGVAQGATSALLANEIRATAKHLWLFDSFAGLPPPTAKDVLIDDIFRLGRMDRYEGTMACGVEEVEGRLARIGFPRSRTRIVPGFLEAVLARGAELPARVCFAYVDFDLYEPIRAALEMLEGRIPVGGVVVVDDYGFFSAGAQAAVDEFVRSRGGRFEMSAPFAFAGHFVVLTRRG